MQISIRLLDKVRARGARRLRQAAALAILSLTLMGVAAAQVGAQSPSSAYSASAPVPLGSVNCLLDGQIVDVRVENQDERAWAAVEGTFIIQNPNRLEPETITVTLPASLPDGLIFDPARLPDFTIRAKGAERQLTVLRSTPSVESQDVVTQAYALALDVPAGGLADIRLSYRQDLGDNAQVSFRFANSVGSRWPGAVGSSLITVRLPVQAQQEQVLSAQPANMSFDAGQITWYDTDFEPKEDVVVHFVNPALWERIQQSRSAAVDHPDSPEAHYQLASLYQQILAAQPSVREASKFEPLMLAELETARQLSAARPGPLHCAIQAELANLYMARPLSVPSASQALQELELALQACSQDELNPAWLSNLAYLHLFMARSARVSGLYEDALAHLDRLEELGGQRRDVVGRSRAELDRERRLSYLAWVDQLLAEGDVERALALATEPGLAEAIAIASPLAPKFDSIQASVSADAAERRIDLRFSRSPWAPDGDSLAAELRQASASWVGIESEWSTAPNRLEWSLTIPFTNDEDLLQKQAAAVNALPDWTELAFVRDILSPQAMDWAVQESWWDRRESYTEVIDLYPTQARWSEQQKMCEVEAAQYAAGGAHEPSAASEMALISSINARLLQLYRDGWGELLQNSRVLFSIEWQPQLGQPIKRTWSAPPGQVQEMKLESWSYSPVSIAVRVGAYVVTALFTLIVLAIILRLIAR